MLQRSRSLDDNDPRPVPDHWDHEVDVAMPRGQTYETLAICRTLALASAALAVAIAEKPAGRFMIRSRTRVVKRYPEDW